MADISCSQISAEYYAQKKKVMSALAVPFALTAAASSLINRSAGSASDLLNSALGVVTGAIWGVDAGDMISSLYRLLDCVQIASSAMGPTIGEAIDALELGQEVPDDMKSILQSQARNSMGTAMDAVTGTPYGKLAEADAAFRNIVNNPDVTTALSALGALEQCLTSMCEGYYQGEFSYEDIKDKIGAGVDNKVSSVIDTVKNAPEALKTSAKTFSTNYNDLKTTVSSKTYSVI